MPHPSETVTSKLPEIAVFDTLSAEIPTFGHIELTHLGSCCFEATLEIHINTGPFGLKTELTNLAGTEDNLKKRAKRMQAITTGRQPKNVVIDIGSFNKTIDPELTSTYQDELKHLVMRGYRVTMAEVQFLSIGLFSYRAT